MFAITSEAKNYDLERNKYVKAIKYYKNKNYKKYQIIKNELKSYPLHANLEYKDLHNKKNINDEKVIEFIEKYKKSYISEKAYINLIYRLSSKGKFDKLISNYKDIDSTDLQCLFIRAKIKQNFLKDIDKEIIPIWLSAKSQPKSCDYSFRWFYKNKKLTDELVWQRIQMALDANNYYLSRYLVRFLSNKNKIWANQLLKVHRNPKKNIISKIYIKDNRYRDTILGHGIARIAKKDYLLAKKYLLKIKSLYEISDDFYNKKLLEIFIIALQKNQKNIFSDKDILLLGYKSTDFTLASANYAIYNSLWNKLIDSINSLPKSISNSEKWIYWKGKSLYKLEKNKEYKVVLEKLSKNRSYYGFLSSHILEKPLNITDIPYEADKNYLQELSSKFEIKRIYELYMLGKKREARKELQYLFKYSDIKDLNSLNVLFKNWGWSEGAILGYGNTKYFDDVKVRFPVLYENYFDKYSDSNIEKSLLLGIARKESIFIQYAKSSAGALGIMQILPRTAYWVLKKAKMKKVSKNYLYNKNMNIFIGSYYFKYLFSKKKSYVESIASYNAGLNIVSKWRKQNNAPEDAWIEFIPYNETRKYVKLVIEYSLVYDSILNNKNTIRVSQLININ
ncbi:MAG: lytic transglycosylase domain-containing protein [Gammaproteobacteria bacterium]|nr:lytic transglycosylase domain-containing protein [Gammaproteobacteria bacterium]MBT7814327.1 lytic transglycosylase domain-containing protein [Gammaproteobacteria bacterium]